MGAGEDFEGQEKSVRLYLQSHGPGGGLGVDTIPALIAIAIQDAGCTELSALTSPSGTRMIMLSESCLYVGKRKIFMKTCGRTRPIHALDALVQICRESRADIQCASFMRGDYAIPDTQPTPHTSAVSEMHAFQRAWCLATGASVKDFIGHVAEGENMHFYSTVSPETVPDTTMEIRFRHFTTPPDAADRVYRVCSRIGSRADAQMSPLGMGLLCDMHTFTPSGFSLNIMVLPREHYITVHCTPQEPVSYLSFETDAPNITEDADTACGVLRDLITIFNPTQVTASFIARTPHRAILSKFATVTGGVHAPINTTPGVEWAVYTRAP